MGRTSSPPKGAADISVSDTGGYFTGTDVEAILQEIGLDISTLPTFTTGTFTPTMSITGGTGNTIPTYTDVYTGRYFKTDDVLYLEIICSNTTGGTLGAGTGLITFAVPASLSLGTIYSDTPTLVGMAYESSATFSNWDLHAILNQQDQELYLYKRSTNTALSSFTGADQNTNKRAIHINALFWLGS